MNTLTSHVGYIETKRPRLGVIYKNGTKVRTRRLNKRHMTLETFEIRDVTSLVEDP